MKLSLSLLFLLCLSSLATGQSSEGKDLVLYYQDGKFGYSAAKGKASISPQFKLARPFSEGLAAVNFNGDENGWGYIDATGKVVITPRFHEVQDFSEGLAAVEIYNKAGLVYPRNGTRLLSLWGYIDKSGNFTITPRFIAAYPFLGGVARFWTGPFVSEDRYGIIDKTGKEIVSPKFDNIGADFFEGFAPFRIGNKWGFIDTAGNTVIDARFDAADRFSEGYAAVAIKNDHGVRVWGFIDRQGELVIKPQFDVVGRFSAGLAKFSKFDSKFGFIDKAGSVAIKAKFDGATDFSNGSAEIFLHTNEKYIDLHGIEQTRVKIGTIDRTGKYVSKPVVQR